MLRYISIRQGETIGISFFAVMDGYNPEKDDMDEGNYELWTLWELDEALYDCIGDYYMANLEEDGVQLHEQDSGVNSDHDGDDE